ncbi:hypothetical protein SERLA73DRAFT_183181 [Serpula lacrymans var. lacrymans S7.3]|uniref:PQ-loop-domain-containing protein n=2 Tax=Serpula lacrymans var. lacrymans TaxID=341189 RepID=F8PZC7_SERL3|nr:uncharacterized protein SERLADRAFT_470202 [Serpula lacrymans var. lacrymans S7.9]EGN98249.1 hypothetical protein SERLA73DRAFT_183181 [Serpula lacrymans var. lacrymans S7.3]EGO23822.1 hypothetical protein SERLADRAFT_470202 [Serpula lacrymans var. lacrymans S7.9]
MAAESEVASSVLGWISIACWIIVYSPQILENYQLQSGEGLSLLFVYVWLLGDLCNLVGAVMGELLPTVILLGLYYTVCDSILLLQVYYYRAKRRRATAISSLDTEDFPTEASHLLDTSAISNHASRLDSMKKRTLRYAAAVIFVIGAGVMAYFISDSLSNGTESPHSQKKEALDWKIQIIGWTSAVSYLGARIPQILKNLKTRCEGLSPALFLFAIMGNITYALSICVASTDREYLIKNASWLAGSALTVFLDILVLGQFFYYGLFPKNTEALSGGVMSTEST